jgi:hypothetical protein
MDSTRAEATQERGGPRRQGRETALKPIQRLIRMTSINMHQKYLVSSPAHRAEEITIQAIW